MRNLELAYKSMFCQTQPKYKVLQCAWLWAMNQTALIHQASDMNAKLERWHYSLNSDNSQSQV